MTGVLADGRCLFRAIAHVACLRNGEEAPDESRQTELADELRAQVINFVSDSFFEFTFWLFENVTEMLCNFAD